MVCIQCSTPIPAGIEEVAWACTQCGQGMVLDEASGLEALDIHYAAGIPPDTPGKPYWVAEGRVSMARQAYGSSAQHKAAAEQFWSQTRRFFVPAYHAPLENLLETAKTMLLKPPTLSPGKPALFEPATLYRKDVQAAAEFIVMAIEAERADMVESIEFELKLSNPILWVIP